MSQPQCTQDTVVSFNLTVGVSYIVHTDCGGGLQYIPSFNTTLHFMVACTAHCMYKCLTPPCLCTCRELKKVKETKKVFHKVSDDLNS